ncbi:SDR family oxidoreductase [soil metagenome]
MGWTVRDMPALAGKRAVVTGATSGLGFETAAALAAAGSEVVLVGRDAKRGAAAIARLRGRAGPELLRFEACDLGDLASVKSLAARLAAGAPIDILVNNAGVMAPPKRRTTEQGFELQMALNFLGHFALTGWLLPRLQAGRGSRVVNLSSLAHMGGEIDFADLQSEAYSPFKAYGRSKAAMLMFSLAMQRRAREHSWAVTACAAHPGWAQTGLMDAEPESRDFLKGAIRLVTPIMAQSAAEGALPTLFAATSPKAQPGGYYGPDGLGEMRGAPALAKIAGFAQDEAAQDRLWAEAESLTGVRWG